MEYDITYYFEKCVKHHQSWLDHWNCTSQDRHRIKKKIAQDLRLAYYHTPKMDKILAYDIVLRLLKSWGPPRMANQQETLLRIWMSDEDKELLKTYQTVMQ